MDHYWTQPHETKLQSVHMGLFQREHQGIGMEMGRAFCKKVRQHIALRRAGGKEEMER